MRFIDDIFHSTGFVGLTNFDNKKKGFFTFNENNVLLLN